MHARTASTIKQRRLGTAAKALALACMLGAGLAAPAFAQKFDANGIGRTELVRHDLDAGHEAIQVRVDFAPGATAARHTHPGVEIAFVIEGNVEYVVDGKTVLLKTGQSLFIPPGVVHSAKNVGSSNAAELATYMVEKGKPVVVPAK
jgi:quercetin dioxygenase-like cupin family protein